MSRFKPPLLASGKVAACHWCKRALHSAKSFSRVAATRDHVKPKSAGGTKTVRCCWGCNQMKKDMTPEQWAEFRLANPKWWERAPARRRKGVNR